MLILIKELDVINRW